MDEKCVIVLTEQYETLLKKIHNIDSKIDKLARLKSAFNGEKLLDNQDLCELLGVSKRTLARYRQKKMITYYTIAGRKSYYRPSDVANLLKILDKESKNK